MWYCARRGRRASRLSHQRPEGNRCSRMISIRNRTYSHFPRSDLQPGVLQVELPFDAVHHIVADHALVAEPDDGPPLGLEQLADQALVGQRAVLGAVVLDLAGP